MGKRLCMLLPAYVNDKYHLDADGLDAMLHGHMQLLRASLYTDEQKSLCIQPQ